jgi:L-amino acid N-acyltransferase YncA
LAALITASEAEAYWTLQAQIIADNQASRALHLKCGFREVGYRERYGHIDDVWHDVVMLERRSTLTGGPDLPTRTCSD